jgi:hypothetical protein
MLFCIFFDFLYISSKPILYTMTENNKRPVFLTVLCILTFVGSSIIIVKNLIALAVSPMISSMKDVAESQMDQSMGQMSGASPGFASLMQKFMGLGMSALEHFKGILLIQITAAAIALAGALLMWKLRKTGFYVFIGAKVILVLAVFTILGANGMALLAVVGSFLVAAVFITLYALNLKAMN